MSENLRRKDDNFRKGGFLQRYAIIIVWILMIIVFSIIMPNTFATWQNMTTMLASKAVLVVISLALLIPMIGGDFDMSVASIMTFCDMMLSVMNVWWHIPIGWAVLLAVLLGTLVGIVNGYLAAYVELNPFIVTMGMQTFLFGIVIMICDAMTITGLDPIVKQLVYTGRLGGISYVFFYALIIAAIMFYFFTYTAWGRRVLLVGQGKNVARLSGINVKKVRFLCFVGSGTMAGFAGILYAGMLGAADPTSGLSYLMPAFAAVFLSTTVITPGLANPWGVVIAVYFLVTGTNGLSLMGISSAVQDIFYGGALIIAVASSELVKRRQSQSELRAILAKEKAESKEGKVVESEANA